MIPAARLQAAIEILDDIAAGKAAEQALTGWARRSRFAGSKDRAAVRDHVFDVLRARRSCAMLGDGQGGRALVLGLLRLRGEDPAPFFSGARFAPDPLTAAETAYVTRPDNLPPDVPDWLEEEFSAALGPELPGVLQALRTRAPVHLRVNLRKANMAQAVEALAKDGIVTIPHSAADTALEITQGPRKLRQSRAYLEGLVELQDAASQAVVQILPLRDGQRVLDYCAGGGGKALAMAGRANITLHAHDAAPDRMQDIPARATRAGVQVTCLPPSVAKGPYDIVLCDAPCSGSGSWRRAPDGKWRLTPERLDGLTNTQDAILATASALVGPDGLLAYATCSLLPRENRGRVDHFLAINPNWTLLKDWAWSPADGTDGFYTAHLSRKNAS